MEAQSPGAAVEEALGIFRFEIEEELEALRHRIIQSEQLVESCVAVVGHMAINTARRYRG